MNMLGLAGWLCPGGPVGIAFLSLRSSSTSNVVLEGTGHIAELMDVSTHCKKCMLPWHSTIRSSSKPAFYTTVLHIIKENTD